MRARAGFAVVRFAAAATCVAALVHRLFWGLGSQTIADQNFFAYLTIQSNIAFAGVAIVAGVVALRHTTDPGWLTDVRVVVLSWTITAGLVFALLMWQAGLRGIPMSVPWSDVVLHFGLPAIALGAWAVGPGRGAARWPLIAPVVAFPIVWGIFTLWRGSLIGWYPYYFLDLRQVSGIGEFCLTCAIALAVFAGVASGLIGISTWHQTDQDVATPNLTASDERNPDGRSEPDDRGAPVRSRQERRSTPGSRRPPGRPPRR